MDLLCGRIGDTVFAVIYGTGVGAVAQGLLGGMMFWFLGLPAPLLWGVMMALLSLMPVLGAFVIWIPAAVFLALAGSWGKAVVLAVWGVTVIGTIDNLLCPLLVGNRLKRHTVLVFISIVGGLIVFGVSGLILGPVVITTTTGMLEIWCRRTAAGQREQAMGVGAGA
jgi:predicted PurR-regulated permease PerM